MNLWGIIASISIIGIWSFIFKDNKIYRCVQGLYLGMYAGIAFANAIILVIDTNITPLIKGNLIMIVPLVFGLLLYVRVFAKEKYAWLSRISMGFIIGVGTAVATFGAINGQMVVQLKSTITSLIVYSADGSLDIASMINNLIIVIGMLSVFSYFLFSKSSQNPIASKSSKLGRYFMMVSFGVAFANMMISRITSFMQSLDTIIANLLPML